MGIAEYVYIYQIIPNFLLRIFRIFLRIAYIFLLNIIENHESIPTNLKLNKKTNFCFFLNFPSKFFICLVYRSMAYRCFHLSTIENNDTTQTIFQLNPQIYRIFQLAFLIIYSKSQMFAEFSEFSGWYSQNRLYRYSIYTPILTTTVENYSYL